MIAPEVKETIAYAEKAAHEAEATLRENPHYWLLRFRCKRCEKNHFFGGTSNEVMEDGLSHRFCRATQQELKLEGIWEVPYREMRCYRDNP